MKTIQKKLMAMLLSVAATACVGAGGVFAFSQTAQAQAEATLESELTNNGQFSVSKYNDAVPFGYVDGATEGLPAGYTGSVLKITTTSGLAYANLDFSAAKINAKGTASLYLLTEN